MVFPNTNSEEKTLSLQRMKISFNTNNKSLVTKTPKIQL